MRGKRRWQGDPGLILALPSPMSMGPAEPLLVGFEYLQDPAVTIPWLVRTMEEVILLGHHLYSVMFELELLVLLPLGARLFGFAADARTMAVDEL